jgi:hypothetical protein
MSNFGEGVPGEMCDLLKLTLQSVPQPVSAEFARHMITILGTTQIGFQEMNKECWSEVLEGILIDYLPEP